MNYYLSPAAHNDIEEIVDYLIKENPNAADKFVDILYESLTLLAENPELGHYRHDLLVVSNVKFWTFKWHYLVAYKPTDPIEIVRVLSGYRDINKLFH